jgi:hypothetical protein
MGSDTAEFFVDDDVPVRVHGSGGGVDILTRDDTRVPIFNTSARQEDQDSDGEGFEEVGERGRHGGPSVMPTTRTQEGWIPQRKASGMRGETAPRTTMQLGELNPSVSTAPSTITASTRRAPLGGEDTKADGLIDQPKRDEWSKTVDRFTRTSYC